MINRSLIRLKVVQLLYAFYQNEGKSVDVAEKELLFSLAKAYDLYNYLLLLMVEVTKFARTQVEATEDLHNIAHKNDSVSHKFIDNKFIMQLEINKQLLDYKEDKKLSWADNVPYIKHLYTTIIQSEEYKAYMESEEEGYLCDRELWRKIYKNIISKDEEIDEILEDQSIYWNDDKEIVDTFVLKTIKRFAEENGCNQELVPEFRDEDDREFAIRLLKRSIVNDEYYHSLISDNTRNWEFNRLAFMDILLMQIALAEMLSFPEIPISVTINEYVEMAKYYSTPKSGKYINGILDHVSKKLRNEGKLLKQK